MVHSSGAWMVASGHAHPTTVLSNADLVARVPGVEEGWIDRVLGIATRRVLLPSESLVELAVTALDDALERAGWESESVDAVICGTSFVDDLLPATASLISAARCAGAVAFDVHAACASSLYALTVAHALMVTDDRLDRVAVCTAERPTGWADYEDRESSIFWGDSAACILLAREQISGSFELVGSRLINDNEFASKVRVRPGGTFHHDGRYSYQQVMKLSEQCADEVLGEAGLTGADVRAFVGHQSNLRLLADLGDRLCVPWERQWHNVEWAGNQGAAGVATAFSAGWAANRDALVDGDHVLLAAVGGGYSGSATLLRWRE